MKAFLLLVFIFIPNHIISQPIYQTGNIAGTWAITGTHISNSTVNPSSGYSASNQSPAASGTNNAQLQSCSASSTSMITSPSISTIGKSNIRVAFGRYEETDFGGQAVKLEWSTDGGTIWNLVNGDVTTPRVLNSWNTLFFDLPAGANNQANLKFRFNFTSDAQNCADNNRSFRIDDFIVGANFKLPIELSSFEVILNPNPLIHWTTRSELNTEFFVIERSRDGEFFTEIVVVRGNGTTNKQNEYTYSDRTAYQGINYYRLKQIDFDGMVITYPVKAVLVHKDEISVYPNLFTDKIKVNLPLSNHISQWIMIDVFGKKYSEGTINQGFQSDEIRLDQLPPGTYFLSILQEERKQTFKVVKM